MIKRLIPLILILCPIGIYGQFGLQVKYFFGQSETLDSVNLSQDGFQASIEYSFRLKQKRIEFHPGLGYRTAFQLETYDGYFSALDLDLNIAIYPFDFAGDCDCPTWSKEGTLIKKGFFLEVSPGISYQTIHRDKFISFADPLPEPIKSSDFVLKIGAAVGLDIGISEQFTLTPMFSVTMLSDNEWSGLHRSGSTGNLDDYTYLGAGLRFAYKPDPKRRRRF